MSGISLAYITRFGSLHSRFHGLPGHDEVLPWVKEDGQGQGPGGSMTASIDGRFIKYNTMDLLLYSSLFVLFFFTIP
jgi:hypothetical protein